MVERLPRAVTKRASCGSCSPSAPSPPASALDALPSVATSGVRPQEPPQAAWPGRRRAPRRGLRRADEALESALRGGRPQRVDIGKPFEPVPPIERGLVIRDNIDEWSLSISAAPGLGVKRSLPEARLSQ